MSIVLVFLLVVALIAGWWLSRQGLTSKPWLETGEIRTTAGVGAAPAAKIGLGVFLAVVGGLFALFGSAVTMRMDYADWYQLRLPSVVWINTAILVLSSAVLQIAVSAARRGESALLLASVAAGGLSTLAFLVGQLLAWRWLVDSGQSLAAHPGASFFYVITGLHGLHILGGLVALARTGGRLRRGNDPRRARLGVELCAIYWHFLLIVWLGMLALLLGWASDLVALCRELL
ncbi:cytochrome c oxidase subunit 3 [Defluviimonas salinarum]|uniref:Cytochrome c oxidase subunit 3 n=1 Tax=Defluviimonas salinarum TaxID=2992147 RepID=A0ABT3J9P8_9RHOB|nr:cytochrome c oxidase subunit 3 [Defluviimonas salinarum]MCW3784415.1 cytochrome c oxidase subunit 3 [Defluviimonas salinarum]